MKRFLSILLALGLLAGCSAPSGGGARTPMGRYIEEEGADLGALSRVSDLRLAEDGGVTFYGQVDSEDGQGAIRRYAVSADGAVREAAEPWLDKLVAEGNHIQDVSSDGGTTAYAIGSDGAGNDVLFRTTDGGASYEPVTPSDWDAPTEEDAPIGEEGAENGDVAVSGSVAIYESVAGVFHIGSAQTRYISGVFALADGFLVAYNDQGVCRYGADGRKMAEFPGYAAHSGTAVYENQLLLRSQDMTELWRYDLDKTERAGTYVYENLSFGTLAGLDGEGLFVGDASGICRQGVGGSLWEKLVDGNLTSLVMPEQELLALAGDGVGGFWAVLREGADCRMARYVYSAETPTNPDTELTIFALESNATVRQTIGEFQRRNPNVRVNFRVAQTGDGAATAEDVIRALNTELLSGKAPDLLVLDGLPVDSYIEKGVLLDLSDLVGELGHSQGLLDNLMGAYERDGRRYGIPVRFTFPVMMGTEEAVKAVTSHEALADQAATLQGGEVPFLNPPLGLWEENGMLLDYYNVCVNDWSSGREVDEEALAKYLETALRLNGTVREHTPQLGDGMTAVSISVTAAGGGGYEFLSMGPSVLGEGKALFHTQELGGVMNLTHIVANLGDKGGFRLDTLFSGGVYTPVGGVGIVASGKQVELAKSFVELMLSDTVQGKYLYDGFPVNGKSLDAMVERTLEGGDDMGFTALCRKLDTPILADSVIQEAAEGQLKGLLDGTLTPAQAAENVVRETELYRAE